MNDLRATLCGWLDPQWVRAIVLGWRGQISAAHPRTRLDRTAGVE